MKWFCRRRPAIAFAQHLLEVPAVPITLAIDEHGIVRMDRLPLAEAQAIEEKFLNQVYERPRALPAPEAPLPPLPKLRAAASNGAAPAWRAYADALVLWEGPARGQSPAALAIEPAGAEFTRLARSFETAKAAREEPDPGGRIVRDHGPADGRGPGRFAHLEATMAPAAVRPPGEGPQTLALRTAETPAWVKISSWFDRLPSLAAAMPAVPPKPSAGGTWPPWLPRSGTVRNCRHAASSAGSPALRTCVRWWIPVRQLSASLAANVSWAILKPYLTRTGGPGSPADARPAELHGSGTQGRPARRGRPGRPVLLDKGRGAVSF